MVEASFNKAEAMQIYSKGILRSYCDFMAPALGAMNSISEVEREKVLQGTPQDTYRDYLDLLRFNTEIGAKGLINSLTAMTGYVLAQSGEPLLPLVSRLLTQQTGNPVTLE